MSPKTKKAAASAADAAFAEALTRARALRPQLDAVTDKLNAQLAAAEKAIAGLKLGVRGSACIELDPESLFERWLFFEKHGNEWRLTTSRSSADSDELLDTMPLVNAPRSVRLLAVGHLKTLVQQMAGEVDKEIAAVEEGVANTEAFIRSLAAPEEGNPPPDDDSWENLPPPGDEEAPF